MTKSLPPDAFEIGITGGIGKGYTVKGARRLFEIKAGKLKGSADIKQERMEIPSRSADPEVTVQATNDCLMGGASGC